MRFSRISVVFLISTVSVVIADNEGLKIDVVEKVECERKTKSGDHILVHYRGTLTDGKEFDASRNRGPPFEFTIGAGRVIKGWDQGLLDMCIGEKRILTVPPSLGYGNRNAGPIPPGSTLIFETELMGIEGVEKPITNQGSADSKSVSHEAGAAIKSVAGTAKEGIKEKILSKITDAAEAVKVTIQDTDGDGQEHNEL